MAKILVVEDDPSFQDIANQILTRAGHSVAIAGTGEAGLESLKTGKADLVVLDVNLPGMSGFEVCAVIRKDPALARLPILMLTVNSRPQDQSQGFKSGADDYLTKPFKPEELRARVFALLRRAA